MLYLTRKQGQSIMIGDDVEISVVEIHGKSVKLGLNFPSHTTVLRREVYDRVKEENRAATSADIDVKQLLTPKSGEKAKDTAPDEPSSS